MKYLQNLRLAPRMGVGFGSVLLLLVAIVTLASLALESVRHATTVLVQEDWVKAESVARLEALTRANARRTMELVISQDPARLAAVRERIAATRKEIDTIFGTLDGMVHRPEARDLLASIKEARGVFVASFSQADAEVAAGQRDAALRRVQDETLPRLDALQERTAALSKLLNPSYRIRLVESDEIGIIGARRLDKALRRQRVHHALRIVDVHLAAIGLDMQLARRRHGTCSGGKRRHPGARLKYSLTG